MPKESLKIVITILRDSLTLKRRALAAKAIRILVARDDRLTDDIIRNGVFELLLPLLSPSFGKGKENVESDSEAPVVLTERRKPKMKKTKVKHPGRRRSKSSAKPSPDEATKLEEKETSLPDNPVHSGALSVLAESKEDASDRVCNVIKTVFFLVGKAPSSLDRIWRLGGAQLLVNLLGKGFGGAIEIIASKLISDIVDGKPKRHEYLARSTNVIESLISTLKNDPEGGKLELGENVLLTFAKVLTGCEEACQKATLLGAEPVLANVFRRSVRTETSIAAMKALIPLFEYDSGSRISFSSATSSFALLAQMLPPPTNEKVVDGKGISVLSERFGPQIGIILSERSVFSSSQKFEDTNFMKIKVTGLIENLRLVVIEVLLVLSSFHEEEIWNVMKHEHIVGRLASVSADNGIPVYLRIRAWEVLLNTLTNDTCGNSLFEFADNEGYMLIAQSIKQDFGRAEAMHDVGVDISCDNDSGMISVACLRVLLKLLTMSDPAQLRTMLFELRKLGIMVTLGQILRMNESAKMWVVSRSLAALVVGTLAEENSSIAEDARKNGMLKHISALISSKDTVLANSAAFAVHNCVFGSEIFNSSLSVLLRAPNIISDIFLIVRDHTDNNANKDAKLNAFTNWNLPYGLLKTAALNLWISLVNSEPTDFKLLDAGPVLASIFWNENDDKSMMESTSPIHGSNEYRPKLQIAAAKGIAVMCKSSDEHKQYAVDSGCAMALLKGLVRTRDEYVWLYGLCALKMNCSTRMPKLCEMLVDFGTIETVADSICGSILAKQRTITPNTSISSFRSSTTDGQNEDIQIRTAVECCEVLARLCLGCKSARRRALDCTAVENLRDFRKLGQLQQNEDIIKASEIALASILELERP